MVNLIIYIIYPAFYDGFRTLVYVINGHKPLGCVRWISGRVHYDVCALVVLESPF